MKFKEIENGQHFWLLLDKRNGSWVKAFKRDAMGADYTKSYMRGYCYHEVEPEAEVERL